MVDYGHVEYAINKIGKRKGTPYHMGNEALAEEIFPFIQEVFPDAIMVKYEISQWIVVSRRARNTLVKKLKEIKSRHEKLIIEIDKAISDVS